ncbi:MAG: GIY-YIG nuclease family protein [Crocinitomicaceae bacterium]|nr:GIY-YIG nuclease family protein [Crocinitomicaceae bacterium]
MDYFVYILECSDKSYYTGVTNDLELRIREHQTGIKKDSYTYTRRPIKLVFYHVFSDPNQAISFEKKVKGWRRAKKEALINDDWEKLPDLSRNYTEFKNGLSCHPEPVEGQAKK